MPRRRGCLSSKLRTRLRAGHNESEAGEFQKHVPHLNFGEPTVGKYKERPELNVRMYAIALTDT